jgi:threonine/homoserine/homoserine lactone efflux protein
MRNVNKIELKQRSVWWDFLTVFLMTFFHPIAILSYLGVYSIISIPSQPYRWNYAIVVLGVTIGALLWWTPIIWFFAVVKRTLSVGFTEKLTKLASWIMVVLGLYLIVDGFFLHMV